MWIISQWSCKKKNLGRHAKKKENMSITKKKNHWNRSRNDNQISWQHFKTAIRNVFKILKKI